MFYYLRRVLEQGLPVILAQVGFVLQSLQIAERTGVAEDKDKEIIEI